MNRRTEIFAESFIPSGSLLWNNLLLSIRSETSVNSFKLKLKQHVYIAPQIPNIIFRVRELNLYFIVE